MDPAIGLCATRNGDRVVLVHGDRVYLHDALVRQRAAGGGKPPAARPATTLAGFIRFASYVPFWSPFVMLTRLTVGRVEPWEVALSFGLLVTAIGVVLILAVRVYAAGVLLYGQRPGLAAIVRAIRQG